MNGLTRNRSLLRTLAWSVYGLMAASAVLVNSSGLPGATKTRLSDALLYLVPIARLSWGHSGSVVGRAALSDDCGC